MHCVQFRYVARRLRPRVRRVPRTQTGWAFVAPPGFPCVGFLLVGVGVGGMDGPYWRAFWVLARQGAALIRSSPLVGLIT